MEACNYRRNKLVGYYTQQCLANILHNDSRYGNHRKVPHPQLLYITYITLFDIKHVQFLYILINVFHCSECQ